MSASEPHAAGDARDDFFVGYLPATPPRLRAWLRGRTILLVLLALGTAGVLTALQGSFARSRFEFGAPRGFEGVLALEPVPHLQVARPGTSGDDERVSRYLLVAPFKHGAGDLIAAHAGTRVRLAGALIHRDDATMLELVPDSIEPLDGDATTAPPTSRPVRLRPTQLAGEIVDAKCFLGVMKPGALKPHRACASLCIRGGIPPVLCVRDGAGAATYWLVVGPDGAAVNEAVLPFVAEPVRLTGEAWRYGDLNVFRTDPSAIERL